MQVVNEALLDEFRAAGRCAFCGRRGRCEAHHLVARGMGGSRRFDVRINLINLCSGCHSSHHAGNRPLRLDLIAMVAAREKVQQAEVEDCLNAMKWGKWNEDYQARYGGGKPVFGHRPDGLHGPQSGGPPRNGQGGVAADETLEDWMPF